ncbi:MULTISPECIES: hypothetical protein [Acidiphilium]|uniref:Uncharacterized protein n=1 Tax=Acidiphilium rubrum TaxID=526 RepID=A0A8G2CJ76_ACIRU|nr:MULTISPECIES: hypothetical protein [Acidiphilium]SIQ46267.1 hypothetical protein SAMN05421828_10521 [Acidiphilium rubrum]
MSGGENGGAKAPPDLNAEQLERFREITGQNLPGPRMIDYPDDLEAIRRIAEINAEFERRSDVIMRVFRKIRLRNRHLEQSIPEVAARYAYINLPPPPPVRLPPGTTTIPAEPMPPKVREQVERLARATTPRTVEQALAGMSPAALHEVPTAIFAKIDVDQGLRISRERAESLRKIAAAAAKVVDQKRSKRGSRGNRNARSLASMLQRDLLRLTGESHIKSESPSGRYSGIFVDLLTVILAATGIEASASEIARSVKLGPRKRAEAREVKTTSQRSEN